MVGSWKLQIFDDALWFTEFLTSFKTKLKRGLFLKFLEVWMNHLKWTKFFGYLYSCGFHEVQQSSFFIKKSLFHLVCSVFFKQKQSVCFNFAKVDVSEQPCQQRVFLEKKCHFNIIEDTSFSIRIFADTGVVVVLQCSFFFFWLDIYILVH